jgi:ribosomal protein L11 methyltransferase
MNRLRWVEAKVVLGDDAGAFAVDVVADIFSDFGLQGTVIEDPGLMPEEGWGEDAVALPEHPAVIGYFVQNKQTSEKCGQLEKRLLNLEQETGIVGRVAYREIDEADWAQSWKAFFHPQRITDRIIVKPTWREFEAGPNDIVLEIDPGMAFGTGLHPTTSGCIAMIETYLKPGDRMLDVGTGSGILMVAGAKLGASTVCGVDADETAVEIAWENLIQNKVDAKCVEVLTGHLTDPVRGRRFDFVAANILSEVVIRLLDDVGGVMSSNAMLIASGIIEKNKDAVIEKMKSKGFDIVSVMLKEGWTTIAARLMLTVSG